MAELEAEHQTDIIAVLDRQAAAWKQGDGQAFGADVTEDVVFTNILGMFVVGREDFCRQHAHIFSTFYKGSVMGQTVERITMVRPDVAVVDTVAEVDGGGPFPPNFPGHGDRLRTRLEQVMVRDGDRWRVAAFHNVPIAPDLGDAPPG